MYDCIIRNGSIIDGTGAAAYQADIALKDGKIACIAPHIEGNFPEIDAAGLTVTPGFIDSHSHSDNAIEAWPDQTEKVEQGITLSVGGQCGGSITPEKFMALRDLPQGSGQAVLIGHKTLRLLVMGPDNRDPSEEELARMLLLLREGIKNGMMGVSFGLIYAPSCYAQTEELVAFARTAAECGGIVAAHIRDERDKVEEATAEFIDILRRSGARGVLSHHKAANRPNWGKVRKTLKMIDDAVTEGIDIYLDVYPYTASHTSLSATLVPKEYHARGKAGLVEVLSDPMQRQAIREANLKRWGADDDLSWILIVKCTAYPQYVGKRLHEIAKLHGTDVYDAVFDMIRDSENACNACYFTMDDEDVQTVMRHPRAMIGTDSSVACGAVAYHPRLRGTFPRVLGRYVREKQVTTLPEMIRKMTHLPAQVYGLTGKGLIKEGYDADLCIFDADTIIDRCDYAAPHERAEGLRYVLVAGEVVAENAVHNGKRQTKVWIRE